MYGSVQSLLSHTEYKTLASRGKTIKYKKRIKPDLVKKMPHHWGHGAGALWAL